MIMMSLKFFEGGYFMFNSSRPILPSYRCFIGTALFMFFDLYAF